MEDVRELGPSGRGPEGQNNELHINEYKQHHWNPLIDMNNEEIDFPN